ncbi:MAG: sensor histidine kinase [Kordiimonas sp.]
MKSQPRKRSIARQVIFNFCWFAVLISGVFSFMTFMLLFTVEDRFLDRALYSERDKLIAAYEITGVWPQPNLSHMTIYTGLETLPDDMRSKYVEEPQSHEFYGEEGRHYHLAHLAEDVFLLAEVSDQLLIRPWRGAIVQVFSITTALLTLIGCWIAYRLARRSVGPLTELAGFVEKATPDNLPDNFAASYPPNEVGVFAGALEKALGRIGQFIKREQNFNRDVSHDLRTPIAVVSGAVEILQKRHKLDKPVAELVDRIELANRHMARTVEALLSLAREEDAERRREPVKILPILEKTIIQFSHLLDGKDVEVEVDVEQQVTLQLQAGVLEILLANLLSNAFEFTSQGVVLIRFKDGVLSISDTGGGVEEEMRETMFEVDKKGEGSSGFGRGLSIVKRVCEHHKVFIKVAHKAGGTEISLKFSS